MSNWSLWLTFTVMIIGVLGTVLPVIPGIPIILVAAVAYGFWEGFHQVTWGLVAILAVITVISVLVDYFATVLGAKAFGAGKYGNWGALIGGVLGIFWFPLGLLLGPLIGATVGELIQGRELKDALRSGLGTLIGLLGGTVVKFILAVLMVLTFAWRIL